MDHQYKSMCAIITGTHIEQFAEENEFGSSRLILVNWHSTAIYYFAELTHLTEYMDVCLLASRLR